jgi:hypothetical protein
MKPKTLVAALLLVAVASIGLADSEGTLTLRSYQLKHKQPEKAATAIRSLLSTDGSVSMQPAANRIVVTDYPENQKSIAAMIEKLDVPPRSFDLTLKLVVASRGGSGAKVPDDLRSISDKLSGVLRFDTFEKVAELAARGKEGDPVAGQMAGGYRASFSFGEYDPATDSVRLSDFRLSRLTEGAAEGELAPLLTTALNLKVDQTIVIGASRSPQSGKVLMLVLTATRARE